MDRRYTYALAAARGRPRKRPKTLRCERCEAKITVAPQGRLPRYCSHSCRQRAYERHKWEQSHLHLLVLHKNLMHPRLHAAALEAVNKALAAWGVPPPPSKTAAGA